MADKTMWMTAADGSLFLLLMRQVGSTNTYAVAVEQDSADSMTITPSEGHIGQVGGHLLNPSANFTRPNDATQYAVGDLVANDTTAGSVVPLTLTPARVAAGSFLLRRVRLRKTGTSTTSASFRVHLWSAAPTPANGDNAAFSTNQSATYLGAFDVSCDRAFSDGAYGSGLPVIGGEIGVVLGSGTTIRALVEARATYTPIANEVFTVTLEAYPN